MPTIEEYCEVRTTGGTYRDWTEVNVAQSFDQGWMRTFRLVCAEPSAIRDLRLKPGDRVDIALAGQVVIQQGYIVTRQAAYDANRHGVQIDGASKAWPIEGASIDLPGGGQFRRYTLEAIANAVLKPHGLKFRMENPPDGANEKFDNVVVRYGESPFDLISRLCRQRACWLHTDPDGTLVAGGAKPGGGGLVYEEGRNILAARCVITQPSVNEVIAGSQQKGSDSLFGRRAAEISASTPMQGGPEGTKAKVLAEMPLNQRDLQLRTNMEAQAIAAAAVQVSVTYKGWLNPEGKLWELKEQVTVRSPMLFPTAEQQLQLRLFGYAYMQNAAGTTTTIDLVNEGAFLQRNPDAQAGPYGVSSPAAQPQALT